MNGAERLLKYLVASDVTYHQELATMNRETQSLLVRDWSVDRGPDERAAAQFTATDSATRPGRANQLGR